MSNFRVACKTSMLVLALALPACTGRAVVCDDDSGSAAVPDGSFEDQPTPWTLASHSTIDDTQSACGGTHSLQVKLDQGIGSTDVTRSAALTGIEPNKEYAISYHYRWKNCTKASISVHIGNYESQVHFDGDGDWGETSIAVQMGAEPTYVDIRPLREGDASQYTGAEFDNNLMWLDDFTVSGP